MNLYAFPFYASIDQQSRKKNGCLAFADSVLYMANNRFLPFVIRKPADNKLIDCINIYTSDDQFYGRLMGNEISYQYFTSGGFDYIMYFGGVLQQTLPCGEYYLEIQGFYSEVFRVLDSMGGLVKLEWKNKGNVGEVLYQAGFMQRLWLDTTVSEPDYKYDIEGADNEANEFIATSQTVKKMLKVQTDLLPPFLMDALAALRLHDTVTFDSYKAKEIEFKPGWPADASGCLGTASIEFLASDPVATALCNEPLVLVETNTSAYSPKTWLCGSNDTTPNWQATGASRCL
jgi:hypothetical protein